MRRGSASYICILLTVGLVYFGSLYITARLSGSTTCFSIFQKEKTHSMPRDESQAVVAYPPVPEPIVVTSVAACPPAPSLAPSAAKPISTSQPASIAAPGKKQANAVIVILCRNSELLAMRRTMREFEDRFNRKFGYPYVFLNDEPFTDTFKASIRAMTDAPIQFGLVPEEMWSVPTWVNETIMNENFAAYEAQRVLYGGSLSYRHMCRFNSGFFYRHPLLASYDYYWRVEPGVHFYCDLDYDPFVFMQENGKEYGFTITLEEIPETIPSIWRHTLDFARKNKLNTTLLRMFGDENGYNLCHFWSNFEIASLNLWRDDRYQAYFDYLDKTGNFYYERWGDAIVHSLAAGLFLNKSQVHFFSDIGYKHDNFAHCVETDNVFGKCFCPEDTANFDYMQGSCLPIWNSYPMEGREWNLRPIFPEQVDDSEFFDDVNMI